MKTGGLWIGRRHLRWLVILLALLPLVPTGMMTRLMLENAGREREEALEAARADYRRELAAEIGRFEAEGAGDAEALFGDLRRIFGDEAAIAIRTPEGATALAWGEFGGKVEAAADAIEFELSAASPLPGWTVRLAGESPMTAFAAEQIAATWWRIAFTLAGVAGVAGVIWWAVNRGLRVDDLRSDQLATVAHELRTPIASMRVLIDSLGNGTVKTEAERAEYLGLLAGENARIEGLAEAFLTFGRLERGDLRLTFADVPLRRAALDAVREAAEKIARTGARARVEMPPDLTARADAAGLASILGNLLDNALKHGGDGVSIVLAAAPAARGRRVRLTVTDDGPGIPRELRKLVFRRWFRGDGRLSAGRSGAGLGLAIGREFARRMGGRLVAADGPAGGCEMVLTLPAGAEASGLPGKQPESSPPELNHAEGAHR